MASRTVSNQLAAVFDMPTRVLKRASSCSATSSASSSTSASNSASTLLSTLVPVLIFAGIWLLAFIFLRTRFRRFYQPRTFMAGLPDREKTPPSSNKLFGWLKDVFTLPDTYILMHHSLDAYLFVRFLKIAVVSCLVGCLITWPVLFPVNATGDGGHSQLDILTMANVVGPNSPDKYYFRYYAHAGCAILFFSFLMWQITRECIYYINLRQAYLMSPLYSSRISSRTVLFTSVPDRYMNVERLRGVLGSGVRRIWLATNNDELADLVEERDKAVNKLEGGETKLIVTANKNRLKANKGKSSEESAVADGGEGGSVASRYISPKERPTHKLGFLGLIGQKVDTIDWSRAELKRLIPEVEQKQAAIRAGTDAKLLNSAFVEFQTQSEAQAAYQSLAHHQILQMAPRFVGIAPSDIIWSNLRIKWWERLVREFATLAAVVATIIFWSIPVAFVGAISQINYLTCLIPAFSFINDIPKVILGVVTGLLPSILLAVLMALLPIYLRLMAKIGGDPTNSAVELTVQNYYFAFQVVQVFLVATLGASAASSVQTIVKDPASVASLLANKIPLANNFYLSYFILQGLGVFASMLVNISGLAVGIILSKLLDKTPRKIYTRWITLSSLGWGTVFPIYTNLFVIAICYAAIAPLVLAFAAIGLGLFYFGYKYNFLYVSNVQIDTKGLIYPRALQQVFVGIYIAEVCLIGLFAIAVGSSFKGAIGPLILMIVMLVATALYNLALNSALGPLLTYLPKTLEYEEEQLLNAHGQPSVTDSVQGEQSHNGTHTNGDSAVRKGPEPIDSEKSAAAQLAPNSNLFTRWLRPDKYSDYESMRRLVPQDIDVYYPEGVEEDAYFNPAVTAKPATIWIPRDEMGLSKAEIADTQGIIDISDAASRLNDKGKVIWDHEETPPIYEEKIHY